LIALGCDAAARSNWRIGGERRGEEAEGKDYGERSAYDHHAATAACWLSTAAIFRQPSILYRSRLLWKMQKRSFRDRQRAQSLDDPQGRLKVEVRNEDIKVFLRSRRVASERTSHLYDHALHLGNDVVARLCPVEQSVATQELFCRMWCVWSLFATAHRPMPRVAGVSPADAGHHRF